MREHTLGVEFDATSDDRYDQSLTRVGGLTYGLQFRDGATLNARVNSTYERLDAPFSVGPGLRIEAGEHAFDSVAIDYRSDQSAMLSVSVDMEAGEYWTGTQRVAGGGLRFRLNEHVAASANITRNVIDLPQGRFAANLERFRLDWSFTPADVSQCVRPVQRRSGHLAVQHPVQLHPSSAERHLRRLERDAAARRHPARPDAEVHASDCVLDPAPVLL